MSSEIGQHLTDCQSNLNQHVKMSSERGQHLIHCQSNINQNVKSNQNVKVIQTI